jgi:Fanconi anemia group M protein
MDRLWKDAKEGKTRAVKNMVEDKYIIRAKELAKIELEKNHDHPKLKLLKGVVEEQVKINKYSKILIFTEFRDNIAKLLETLQDIKLCSVEEFVGQASKSTKGMSQKKQVEVLERFKEGYITCLVATAVAEEGIDVPDVDLVIFYTPVPSAIRSIQRKGRTARRKEGKLIILISKNTRDEAIFWISKRREKGMSLATKKLSNKKVGGQKRLDHYENNS